MPEVWTIDAEDNALQQGRLRRSRWSRRDGGKYHRFIRTP